MNCSMGGALPLAVRGLEDTPSTPHLITLCGTRAAKKCSVEYAWARREIETPIILRSYGTCSGTSSMEPS